MTQLSLVSIHSQKQATLLLGEADRSLKKGLLSHQHSQLHHQPFSSTSTHWRPLRHLSGGDTTGIQEAMRHAIGRQLPTLNSAHHADAAEK